MFEISSVTNYTTIFIYTKWNVINLIYPTNVITTFKRSKNLQKQNTYYSFSNIDTFLCSMCVVVCFNIFLFKNIYTKKN